MAKRTPRTEAGDTASATPRKAKTSRTREGAAADAPVSGGGAPSIATTEAARPAPEDTHPPEDTLTSDPNVLEANHRRDEEREPSAEEIRARAYRLYVERGGGHGLHEDDWLRAEQELRKKR